VQHHAIPGDLPLGVKRQGREPDHSHLHLVLRSRRVGLYLYSLICLYDIVLNYLSTGTALPLPYHTMKMYERAEV
jgi:hypothetical protein